MSAGPSPVPPPPPPPPSTWSLADWVDFEILLAQEEPGTEPAWLRAWEKHRGPASSPPHDLPRRGLFRRWLEFRRADPTLRLPGEALASGWRSLSVLAGIAGVLLGGTLTGTLLHYRGTEPVNVAWFLVATLGLQLVLLVGTLGVAALRRTTGLARELRPLRHALTGLAWLCSAGLRRLPGERREELRARVANLLRKREIYGSLATWPILVVTQTFAVGYNVGILVLLLAHVAATDLAFGWQSTLDLGPDAVHRIVTAVASPWAWFAPNPNPTLPQIVGSRFSYADGMSGLDRAALAAWWPFLAYAVAFYGAGLRAAALAGAWIGQRRALDRWAFDHEGCNALARRLTGPAIHACSDTAALRIPDTPALPDAPAPTRKACLALVA
ncbi:MAG: DUF2868 domain-containing protein, partial [Verrucomicrobiales bacterium]|nr:DUF2868 domain-containing protein [Verrucomicrobiales bacterium]